mmetsp:Transcript_103580/g.198824  ORF Transcript_103580/g.198824 Transcript_103580/m.198824 type:complete len:683 (+) Transcript_103580:45-2093(+)
MARNAAPRWQYIYLPHWEIEDPSVLVAVQDTWLKHSTAFSWELPGNAKTFIAKDALLPWRGGLEKVQDPIERDRHEWTHLHRGLLLPDATLRSLQANRDDEVPMRMMLTNTYASERDEAYRDLLQSYADARGPGLPWPQECAHRMPSAKASRVLEKTSGLLLPHGSFWDAGPLLAHGCASLDAPDASGLGPGCPGAAIILSPGPAVTWSGIALCDQPWQTPLGRVRPHQGLLSAMVKEGFNVDRRAHASEEAVEHALLFLRRLRPGLAVLPIAVGTIDWAKFQALVKAIVSCILNAGEPVLLIGISTLAMVSTMTPEERRACVRDSPVLEAAAAGDATALAGELQSAGASSPFAAAAVVACSKELGLDMVEVISHEPGFATVSFRSKPVLDTRAPLRLRLSRVGSTSLPTTQTWFDGESTMDAAGDPRSEARVVVDVLQQEGPSVRAVPTLRRCFWRAARPGTPHGGVVVCVAGAGAGPGPAGAYGPYCLYARLASMLPESGISVLLPIWTDEEWQDLRSSVLRLRDTLIALVATLEGVTKPFNVVLVGWSAGGAVVLEVGARVLHKRDTIRLRGVATLATQSAGVEDISLKLAAQRLAQTELPLLLIAGDEDVCLSPQCTDKVAADAAGPHTKKVMLPGDNHGCLGAEPHVVEFVQRHLLRTSGTGRRSQRLGIGNASAIY